MAFPEFQPFPEDERSYLEWVTWMTFASAALEGLIVFDHRDEMLAKKAALAADRLFLEFRERFDPALKGDV